MDTIGKLKARARNPIQTEKIPLPMINTNAPRFNKKYIVIKSNNNSLNRFINNMSGGVQGRHVIFMYDPDSPTNEYIQFNESSASSGTGISIAGRTTSNISISAGGIITFIFWNNYWRYHA
jgi:hypothetical protein